MPNAPTIPHRQHRQTDLLVDTLVHSEFHLRARVADFEAQLPCYRELLQLALAHTHELTLERRRLSFRLRALVQELRALRDRERSVAA